MNEQLVKLIDKLSYDGTLYSFGHIIYKETVRGPWVTFILSDGSDVYYETEAAKVTLEELEARGLSVVGLNIGSSVEGSDVEIGPYNLEIDDEFTTGAFWRVIDSVDDDAKFYWKRDNAAYYSLRGRTRFLCLATKGCSSSWRTLQITCTEKEGPLRGPELTFLL